jgi:hypothetical protein
MPAPIIRRYTTVPAPLALNVFAAMQDDITALTFQSLNSSNSIQDMLMDPFPAAGLRYEFRLFKSGLDSGRSSFSDSMNPASGGRIAVGPITLTAGQLSFMAAQRLGALTATSIIVKYATGF